VLAISYLVKALWYTNVSNFQCMRNSNVALSVDNYSGFNDRTTIKSLPFLAGEISHSDVALERMN